MENKKAVLVKYEESFRKDLHEKGAVSFSDGETAKLRKECISLGLTEGEVSRVEDPIIKDFFANRKNN